jgi:MFS family permease
VIDRFGAARMLPLYLMPLAVSMVAVAGVGALWGAPLYLLPTGISSGVSATLLTALWVELYGPARLAEVRSTVSAANVIASGTAPSVMGWLIDANVSLSLQAVACLAFIVTASIIATRVRTYAHVEDSSA